MENSYAFLNLVLETLPEQIVVIDSLGEIQFVNRSWTKFGEDNQCSLAKSWDGVNYLSECDKARAMGDELAEKASSGIRAVIHHEKELFYFEYPCHSPEELRWFMMRVSPFELEGRRYFVISHQDITNRKLAEEQAQKIAKLDGLTGIANRRTFNEFLRAEWLRCRRLSKPVSLALIDIDDFKQINDNYGHQFGDECLIAIADVLKKYAQRPGDICARYGGEEFVLVWGDTDINHAQSQTEKMREEVASLNLSHSTDHQRLSVTVSVGLAESLPAGSNVETDLVARADAMLYSAKAEGKNCVVIDR